MTFTFPLLNPMKFVNVTNIDASFDGDFAVNQLAEYQDPDCYFQKWEFSDSLRLQLLSDFVPSDLVFRDVFTNKIIFSAPWVEAPTFVIGQTFKVYEMDFDFVNLPEGKYRAFFNYTDENEQVQNLVSEPITVALKHENTLLLTYKNSVNDFDVIFDTNIVFTFRVEARIMSFNPGNSRDIYNDQRINPTLLNSTPFRKFRFYVGYKYGVPEWMLDKVNRIQSVDQVQYNGIYYQILNGSDWELESNVFNAYIGGNIEVQPTENKFNRYTSLPTDESGSGNIIYNMGRRSDHFNISDDFSVVGVFKSESLLEQIVVTKRAPAGDLLYKVGTTPGGSEIGEFTARGIKRVQTAPYPFTANTTLYITGLAGADMDFKFLYLQTDAPAIDLGNLEPVTTTMRFPKNTLFYYEEMIPGELDTDFDLATGLGKPNTIFSNCAICDGRNGTEKWDGCVPVAQDLADPDFAALKDVFGTKQVALSIGQLPKFTVKIKGWGPYQGNKKGDNNGPDHDNQDFKWVDLESPVIGNNEAHNNVQKSKTVLLIKAIS